MTAIWKPIPGYEGWYEASSEGCIRRLRGVYNGRGVMPQPSIRELAPLVYRKGYLKVQLGSCAGTKRPTRQFIHRVVYSTFHGPIPTGMTVNHIDGNKQNNRADNLDLMTTLEQSAHARSIGLLRHRTANGLRKASLTHDSVSTIKADLLRDGSNTNRIALAKRFGVSKSTIRFIQIGRVWKDTQPNPGTEAGRGSSR